MEIMNRQGGLLLGDFVNKPKRLQGSDCDSLVTLFDAMITFISLHPRFCKSATLEDEGRCPHINMIAMSLLAGISVMVAVILLETSEATNRIISSSGSDLIFYAICLAGGIFGGLLNVALFGETGTRMEHARKFLGGVCSAVLFTAMFCKWMGTGDDMRVVFALSGTISLLAYGILRAVVPKFTEWASKRAESKLNNLP